MFDITVYSECPTKHYYNSVLYLEKQNKARVKFVDSRFFTLLLVKINNHFSFFRSVRKLLTGKCNAFENEPSFSDILQSFIAPVSVLFKKNIILGFSPCSNWIYYFTFLKLIRKRMIYMTSWTEWDKVPGSFPFRKHLWHYFLKGTATVAMSGKSAQDVAKRGAKVVQIPHGIDTSLFKPGNLKKPSKFTLLYVGRMIKEKGLIDMLELSKELKNMQFIFVGSGPLEQSVKKYPVKFLGQVNGKKELVKIYNGAHIFVLNTWEERYGLVLLEAMSCGLPVISTSCIGPKEIVFNGKNGLIIPVRDKKALKKAILYFYKNRKKAKSMGDYARKFILGTHRVEMFAEKWLRLMKGTFEE